MRAWIEALTHIAEQAQLACVTAKKKDAVPAGSMVAGIVFMALFFTARSASAAVARAYPTWPLTSQSQVEP